MNKLLPIFIIFSGIVIGSLVINAQTIDQEKELPEIAFPIKELGDCGDKSECFAYCELPENSGQCLDFAKKYQLLSGEEIRVAERVQNINGGPGGCDSHASCERYCDDTAHIDECIVFAEENGLMQGRELEEAKKVRDVIRGGGKLPGGCNNKTACRNYCELPDHMEECLRFAEASGFLSAEELEQAKRFIPLMKEGLTPGGCKSKEECEAYCDADEHFEECISFAEKSGMIPEEERKNIEAFKKAGGRGPGGCRGRQCQAFCSEPANRETCFEWAKENGLISEEDMSRMQEGMMERGTEGRGGQEMTGPGGCRGPQECTEYCKEHMDECRNFTPSGREGGERQEEGFERRGAPPMGRPGEEGGFRGAGEFEFRKEGEGQIQEEFRREYEGQFEQELERQYEGQYQEQYREQFQGESGLPTGEMPENYLTPADQYRGTEGTYGEPQSSIRAQSLLGSVLSAFLELLETH